MPSIINLQRININRDHVLAPVISNNSLPSTEIKNHFQRRKFSEEDFKYLTKSKLYLRNRKTILNTVL